MAVIPAHHNPDTPVLTAEERTALTGGPVAGFNPGVFLEGLMQPPNMQEDIQSQLDAIYGPQYQMLANQEARARAAGRQGDARLAAMYKALGADIGKSAIPINQAYTGGINASNAAYQTAKTDIGNAYASNASRVADMLKALGLQAAGPDVFKQGTADSSFLQNLASVGNLNTTNALNLSKQGALNYNTAQKNIAGFAGNEKRAALQAALENRLGQLSDTQLSLAANRSKDYASMLQGQQQQYIQNQLGIYDRMYKAAQDASVQGTSSSGNDLKSQLDRELLYQRQMSNMTPSDKVLYRARELVGPYGATNLANDILRLAENNQDTTSLAFARRVLDWNNKQGNPWPKEIVYKLAMDSYKDLSLKAPSVQDILMSSNPYSG